MEKTNRKNVHTKIREDALKELDDFIENSYGAIKNRSDVLEYLILKYVDRELLYELLKFKKEGVVEKFSYGNLNKKEDESIKKNNNSESVITDDEIQKLKNDFRSIDL